MFAFTVLGAESKLWRRSPYIRKDSGSPTEAFAREIPPLTDQVLRRNSLAAMSPDPMSMAKAPTDTRDTKGTPPVFGSRPPTAAEAELPLPP